MKTVILTIIFLICHSDCAPKKPLAPLDKNVNLDFINMEGGGVQKVKPGSNPISTPTKPSSPVLTKPESKPSNAQITPSPKPASPLLPIGTPTAKPGSTVIQPGSPVAKTASVPSSPTNSVPPSNLNSPASAPSGGSTAKPGSTNVQQLITYYDSKGQASVIRPYSYADAVKKNKN